MPTNLNLNRMGAPGSGHQSFDATGEPGELIPFRKGDLAGYLNAKGEVVIQPRFQVASAFSEGLAGVPVGENGWGFIDRAGKEVIPGKFAWVYGGFRHGVAEVAFDRKRGYINKKGEWIWKPSE